MHIYTGGQEQTLLVRDTVGRRINISVLNNEYRVITALERARIQVFISYYMMGEDVTSSKKFVCCSCHDISIWETRWNDVNKLLNDSLIDTSI